MPRSSISPAVRKMFLEISFVALALSLGQAQQPSSEPLLDHMVGTWILHGTVEGKETIHDVTGEWILNHEYAQIHEISREKDAKGQPQYEAIVLIEWNPKSAEYACEWLDTTSGGALFTQVIGHGKREGDKIPFLFKMRDGTVFHNTFAYNSASDTWQWLLDGEEQGKLKPFARMELKRK